MKSKIFQILEQAPELKVAFYGTNIHDMFMNGFEGLKRLIFKKRMPKKKPDPTPYILIKQTIELTAKTTEELYEQWIATLLHHVQNGTIYPIEISYLKLTENTLKAQLTSRRAFKKDKLNIPVKNIIPESHKVEEVRTGYKITFSFEV